MSEVAKLIRSAWSYDARGRRFPISPRAMALKNVISEWGTSRRRYGRALVVLLGFGFLIRMRVGGRRPEHSHEDEDHILAAGGTIRRLRWVSV